MKIHLALLLLFGIIQFTEQQFGYARSYYASLDDSSNNAASRTGDLVDAFIFEERLNQLGEKLTNYFTQQNALLKTRIEILERNIFDLKRAIAQDWNATADFRSLYKLFTTRKSWDDAQSLCRLFGSQLAVIDTEVKNNFVKELILDSHSNRSTGAVDEETVLKNIAEELWIGIKTRAEMVGYGRPQFTNFYDEERVDGCTSIDASGKWKIRPCNDARPFICQQANMLTKA